ncbi:P-loop containing nucleoside triphosphate hydrolase protein [Plectosphaerella cucumerina]|uniref:P-loop containing nucleoside triphosphate hydrolase protein n=1 Tax=Plectosphaerella cucumerina TaxID=40658 RepID=A0A8K0TCH1_9PEZI|nr:P-loop containing nucleoside triphosphate hydrolase protein [Plectosphaerella cucumerina]
MVVTTSNTKPIFCATHPRACSTAFERVFMTQRENLSCVHEPFGDAFYYGPERLSERYENDPEGREQSGFANTTYADVLRAIDESSEEGAKRIFIKDIIHYLFPPAAAPADLAPSVVDGATGTREKGNPTVLPLDILRRFQFTFLIRHPRRSIPSYFRCTVPPLDKVTGFSNFDPLEAGYDELRRFFDLCLAEGLVDPANLVVIDADDLLDDPEAVLRAYCERVGLDFCEGMLNWSPEDTAFAQDKFAKWQGFHDDALRSQNLRARSHANKTVTRESEDREWTEKYGEDGARVIRETVEANTADYEYLKKFAIRV